MSERSINEIQALELVQVIIEASRPTEFSVRPTVVSNGRDHFILVAASVGEAKGTRQGRAPSARRAPVKAIRSGS